MTATGPADGVDEEVVDDTIVGDEVVDVVIVGAGLSGIGMAAHLRRTLPRTTFVVLEARDAIGGTWDLFRYPGVRSDSDLHTYAYGFRPWTHDDTVASGDRILGYLADTAAEIDLAPHLRLGHRVTRASWSGAEAAWTVEATGPDGPVRLRARWVVAGTGYYRYDHGHEIELPGRDAFLGAVVHPQHWPADLEWAGKRVVVIGSGATAATLVPALAADAAHVTMLQRSPTYFVSLPSRDGSANRLGRLVGRERAFRWIRARNVVTQAWFYRLSRRFPGLVGRRLVRGVARRLPPDVDVARHFTPRYGPWDQRVCLTPDGDLFGAISDGRASVVTDAIDRLTPSGIRLASGTELPADVVVTATGIDLLALGGIDLEVDGRAVTVGECLVYRSTMLSGVPNFAFVFGYTNASWTLKVDLVCRFVCRCLAHQARTGTTTAVAVPDDPAMPTAPMIDFTSGYVQRAVADFPRQGTGPWSVAMSVRADTRRLRDDPVDDGVLRFSGRAAVREGAR